jgi:Glycosyl hydrolase family 10
VTVHVADTQGNRLIGASVTVQQTSKDFPLGSAMADTLLGNPAYQVCCIIIGSEIIQMQQVCQSTNIILIDFLFQSWFLERFNAAVFENELKWYATEPAAGLMNYDTADRLLDFVRANRIMVRGHNIFWENQDATPAWVRYIIFAFCFITHCLIELLAVSIAKSTILILTKLQ